jgi:spore germination protein YaaH
MKSFLSKTIFFLTIISLAFPAQLIFAQENLFYYFDNVNGFKDFKKNYKKIDVVAPQVYTVGEDLKVKNPKSKSMKVIKEAKKRKVATMPLLVQDHFDKVLMSNILLDQNAQDEIIDYMIKEADKYDFIGWQFDFENINHLDRDMYSAFVKKTYARLQAEDLQFSVAVVVRSRDYDPNSSNQDWSSAYDYKELAKNSDFLSLMTYDEPNSKGPVASLPYVERSLNYLLTQAPAEKLSLGVPLYCWHWQDGMRIGSTTYGLAEKKYRKGKERSRGYDETYGAEYYKFKTGKIENMIWCDSSKGFEAKEKLVERHGLRGFSLWALGQGDKNLWDVF